MAQYERVVIVGVGLLGGSIGHALRKRGLARTVVGTGRRLDTLRIALDRGAVDEIATDPEQACRQADWVVVCTPVQLIETYVLQCQRHLAPDSVITDVGSTKWRICEALRELASERFCGSHPMAGSDKSGVESADADLFLGRLTIVTPWPGMPEERVERVERFWQSLGSRTLRMPPEEHDQAVARISHLPHIVAAALAGATPDSLLPLAAAGWCDTTRVAAGGPELWRQILEENRVPVLRALEHFATSLDPWLDALRRGDGERLETLLTAGKQKRDSVGN